MDTKLCLNFNQGTANLLILLDSARLLVRFPRRPSFSILSSPFVLGLLDLDVGCRFLHLLVGHVGVELGVTLGSFYVDSLLFGESLEFGALPFRQPPFRIRERTWSLGIKVLWIADLLIFPLFRDEDLGPAAHDLLYIGSFDFLLALWHGLLHEALEAVLLRETFLLHELDVEEVSRARYLVNLEVSHNLVRLLKLLVCQNVQVGTHDPLVSIFDFELTAIHELECFVLESHLDQAFEEVAVLRLRFVLLHLGLYYLLNELLDLWEVG